MKEEEECSQCDERDTCLNCQEKENNDCSESCEECDNCCCEEEIKFNDDCDDEEPIEDKGCDNCGGHVCDCDEDCEEPECKEELPNHADSFNQWCKWFKSCEDHYVDPDAWQSWNGAVDTLAQYVMNILCGDGRYSYDDAKWIVKKIKTFKEP